MKPLFLLPLMFALASFGCGVSHVGAPVALVGEQGTQALSATTSTDVHTMITSFNTAAHKGQSVSFRAALSTQAVDPSDPWFTAYVFHDASGHQIEVSNLWVSPPSGGAGALELDRNDATVIKLLTKDFWTDVTATFEPNVGHQPTISVNSIDGQSIKSLTFAFGG